MQIVEAEAFKDFCKKMKVKTIQDYERAIDGGSEAVMFDRKCELEQIIKKQQG